MGKTRNTGFSNNAIQYNSGSIAFVSGSTTRMFISASGFVGMGITGSTNPVRLSVSGTIESLTDGSGEGGQITLRGTTFQYGIDNFNGTGVRFIRENDGTGTSGITQMFISASGFTGIGTTSPTSLLEVQANQNAQTGIRVRNSTSGTSAAVEFGVYTNSGNGGFGKYSTGSTPYKNITAGSAYIYNGSSGDIALLNDVAAGNISFIAGASSTAQMFISASGNVGIGTTSPDYPLVIQANSGAAQAVKLLGRSVDNISILSFHNNANNTQYGYIAGIPSEFRINSGTSIPITFTNLDTERMRITTAGYLYLNTTSNPLPNNAQPQFAVVGGTGTDAIAIKHTVDGNNTLNIWQTGTSQHNAIAFYKGDSQTNRGNIVVNTSGTSYNSVSDYRLKENIVPLENGLDRLMQLKPSKFNWIETGDESEGFIAHEIQEIFPDAVTGEKDATYASTGNIKPQSVDYGRITPLLVKAIQELKAENDALKTRIETLKNK